jgi:hypothetical protein
MTRRTSRLAVALLMAVGAAPVRAHHGTAAVGAMVADGPGAALDTASPLPLGQGTALGLVKSEYVDFQRRAGFADQRRYSSFSTVAVGYGLRPWLSAFVFQPYGLKAQDGAGTSAGLGDTNLMLSASLKWDEGLRLAPERESLDDLADWHLGAWASCSLPVGPTTRRDDRGAYFAPDMQIGFHGPSPGMGLSVMRQLSTDLTFLGEASYQHFLDQRYPGAGYRYRFGGEARLNTALADRAWASGTRRVDVIPELAALGLRRDQEDGVAVQATGGTILYGQLGARLTLGAFSVGAGVKRAVARSLNQAARQQGSEGLEAFRAALILGYSARL